jgi:DUF4097 and DUF4098 domain-containing protein YvlB
MIAHRLLPVVIIALATVTSACVLDAEPIAATGMFERTLTVSGPVTLDVETGSGSIEIRRGPTSDVRVVGRVRAHHGFWNGSGADDRVRAIEAAPPIEQTGNTIDIGRFPRREMGRNVSISYEITVPDDTRVRSRSGSGSLEIDAVQGPVEAETGSGSIRIGRIPRTVTASTGSGSIEVLGAGDGLDAQTGSGSITARDVNGAMRARSGSGSIRIQGTPTRPWSADTGSGRIALMVPTTAAFELDVETGSGSISTSHPIETRGSVSKRHVRGRVRGGGPVVHVSTGSGSIELD